jgi:ABC-type phosphate/phosphonate transport system ATPase subunit
MVLSAEGLPPPAVAGETSREMLVEARNVWFAYDRRTPVLKGVSLSVPEGRMIMILGRSGSGKTTLLKVLKGLLRPYTGAVTGADRIVPGSIAYIPQTLGLVRNMTALENATMGALVRTGMMRSLVRLFPGETTREARALLTRLGLAHKLNEPVFGLSGGERQRVAIARALMQRSSLILADEFVSQLDYHTGAEILVMMREIAASGVAVVMTTHEVDVALKYADEVAVMRQGELVHRAETSSLSEAQLLELLR